MDLDRRRFLQSLGGTAVIAATLGWPTRGLATATDSPEALARELHRILSAAQRAEIAFPWDHVDGDRGLLRARVSANWNVTAPELDSDFFTRDQRALVRAIFEGLIDPGWHERYDRQLETSVLFLWHLSQPTAQLPSVRRVRWKSIAKFFQCGKKAHTRDSSERLNLSVVGRGWPRGKVGQEKLQKS